MRFVLAVVLAVAASGPALSFDRLRSWISALDVAQFENAEVFHYGDPSQGFRSTELERLYMIPQSELAMALIYPDTATGLSLQTGIPFFAIDSYLQFGVPPGRVLMLGGPPGFAMAATVSLPADGLTESEIGGWPVFSRGEDYKIDRARVDSRNPFGGPIGQSQRFAIGKDVVVFAPATEVIETAISGLDDPDSCLGCPAWLSMLDAMEAAAGEDAHLDQAMGMTAAVFVPFANAEAPAGDGPEPFALVMLGVVTSDNGTAAQLAVGLPGDGDAEDQLDAYTERFVAFMPDAELSLSAASDGPGSVIVVTASFDGDGAAGAYAQYREWMISAFRREFTPLMPS